MSESTRSFEHKEEEQRLKQEKKQEKKEERKREREALNQRRKIQGEAAELLSESLGRKKSEWYMNPYYLTFGGLILLLVYVAVMMFLNKKPPLNKVPVIDDEKINDHNLVSQWKQAATSFWESATLLDAKKLMMNSFASHTNINRCLEDETAVIPDSFDARNEWPNCKLKVQDQKLHCSASYAVVVASAFSERTCIHKEGGVLKQLSAQEIISCDTSNRGCRGGYLNNALEYVTKIGLSSEQCMPYKGSDSVKCSDMCSEITKDKSEGFCVAFGEEDIKKEIMKNGPVIATMEVYTDFLTYSKGVYYKGEDVPKFSGMHSVKVIGWGVESGSDDEPNAGSKYWIIENSWGEDWGMNGYAKVSAGQNLLFEQYAYSVVTHEQALKMKKEMEEKKKGGESKNIPDMDLDDEQNNK